MDQSGMTGNVPGSQKRTLVLGDAQHVRLGNPVVRLAHHLVGVRPEVGEARHSARRQTGGKHAVDRRLELR